MASHNISAEPKAESSVPPESFFQLRIYRKFSLNITEDARIHDILGQCPHVKQLGGESRLKLMFEILGQHVCQRYAIAQPKQGGTKPAKLRDGLYACDESFAHTRAKDPEYAPLSGFSVTHLSEVREWVKSEGIKNKFFRDWVRNFIVEGNGIDMRTPMEMKWWVKRWNGDCQCIYCTKEYENWPEKLSLKGHQELMGIPTDVSSLRSEHRSPLHVSLLIRYTGTLKSTPYSLGRSGGRG